MLRSSNRDLDQFANHHHPAAGDTISLRCYFWYNLAAQAGVGVFAAAWCVAKFSATSPPGVRVPLPRPHRRRQ